MGKNEYIHTYQREADMVESKPGKRCQRSNGEWT